MGRALAGGVCAVMAIGTITGNVHVIEIGRQPGGGAVTIVAGVATGDVRRILARSGDTVMT